MKFQKIIFSYSRADSEFVLKLAKDLRAQHFNVWLDILDIPKGNPWDEEIEKALKNADCMLVILSPTSVASANVMDEVSYALEKNKKVVPILFKECEIPFRVRRRQHIDFTHNYAHALNELLVTLEGSDHPEPPRLPEPNREHFATLSKNKIIIAIIIVLLLIIGIPLTVWHNWKMKDPQNPTDSSSIQTQNSIIIRHIADSFAEAKHIADSMAALNHVSYDTIAYHLGVKLEKAINDSDIATLMSVTQVPLFVFGSPMSSRDSIAWIYSEMIASWKEVNRREQLEYSYAEGIVEDKLLNNTFKGVKFMDIIKSSNVIPGDYYLKVTINSSNKQDKVFFGFIFLKRNDSDFNVHALLGID